MAPPGPEDQPSDPFGGMPLFGDLARMLSTQGPVNWEIARQMGRWLSTNGQPESNIDPLVRVRYEELYRIAEMHVAEATGLQLSPGASTLRVLTRSEWAASTLSEWQPLLEKLATSLASPAPALPEEVAATPGADELMAGLAQSLSPLLLGMQSGSMVGHLARQAFGMYDLPVPRRSSELLVVCENVDEFAEEWSLELDDARLFIAVLELTHHTVMTRGPVRARFDELVGAYVSGFEPDPSTLEDRLSGVDPSDMEALQSAFGDPEALLGAMQTPAQRLTAERLAAAGAALIGYVDHVTAQIGARLVGNPALLSEALRRRRVARGQGERFVERLFGLEVNQSQIDRGAAFVAGVVDRSGEEALLGLWASASSLPTPAEIAAPGLWLERISYEQGDSTPV
ncbi:MAG TPA: zinc-dependent metalloprotease [Acidimicrobiales bacterium]|nr:zinc-dependent metalloprotease [Acidimicrobiales bacterium]